MTKLISGRVKKTPSANVSASRYDFLKLSEAEPDLGLPAANGYILSGNVDGTRLWILPSTVAASANVANTVLSISNFTTANLTEGSNLYYTNTRVYANVIGLLNTKSNVVDLTTANVVELTNLYYTNARVYANVIGLLNEKANVVDLTTSNVTEGNNLYYTNARVYANVIGLLNNKSNVVDLTTANVVESASNLYYTVTRANVAIDNRVTKAFIDNLGISSSSAVFAENANVANIVLSISNFTTANLAEGSNLYYTNARVYANVIGLLNGKSNVADLTTANVTESASNLYYTNARVYANISPLLFNYQTLANAALKANVVDLTTSNVVEGTNLYYTNNRVYANVVGLLNTKANVVDLTTSNVVEGTNLYYTNTRVYANVVALLTNYTGNITAGNILANAIYGQSGGFITGANLISTNIISATTWTGLYAANVVGLNTANVAEFTNLYYTNARVYANISPLLFNYQTLANAALKANVADLTTANVSELTNLYYTNARVYSNIGPLLFNYQTLANAALKANVVDLTTANVTESTTNLYYTNARVLAGLVTANLVVNDATIRGNLYVEGDVVTLNAATLSIEDKNIVLANGAINSTAADGAGFNIDGAQANLKYRNTGDKFEFNKSLDVLGTLTATAVYSNVWNNLYTSNVIESAGNLYYTVARANAAINDRVTKAFIDNLGINSSSAVFAENANVANIVLSIGNFTTSNLAEGTNLYYTNAKVNAQVESNLALKANVNDLTTANVIENTNLYYTNARVNSQVESNLALKANVADLNTSNVIEGTNLYYTNARVNAQVESNLALKANVNDLTTSNVTELNNLYYTNVRVYANVIPLLNLKANVNDLTTANVTELNNLYYTNARVYANVIPLLNLKANVADLSTSNVIEGTNLYYTNARVYANVIPLLNLKANVADLNTSNIIEGTNLYYTNARVQNYLEHVDGNILPTSAGPYDIGSETRAWRDLWLQGTSVKFVNSGAMSAAANTFTMTDASGNVVFTANSTNIPIASPDGKLSATLLSIVPNYSTSNVAEGINLYYTNARVYANVIGLLNAKANVVDLTTANVAELNNLYYTNARVYANVIGLLNAKSNVVDLTTSNVAEGTNLYFTNARAYANLTAASINALSDVDTVSYPPALNQALMWDGIQWSPNTITLSSAALVANIAIVAYNANIANVVLSIDNFTTSNLKEGSNLYYTIERANVAIDSRVTKQFVDALGINASTLDGIDSTEFALSTTLTTSNVAEGTNLYYTNARVYSNVIALLPTLAGNNITIEANGRISANISAASVTGLNTANVAESASNQYFTNARARAAISAGTGVVYDNSTGIISIGQNVDTLANVTFGQVNITGNLNVFGNVVGVYANTLIVNDPLIQLGYNNPSDVLDLGFIGNYNDSGTERRAGLFRDATDKKFKFFDNTTGDPSATTVDTVNPSFRLANVVATTFEGNVVGNVTGFVSSIGNFTTTDLTEGTNLYYTNARVYANVIGLLTNKVSTADLTTANVVELTNLYYTNSRVYSNVIGLLDAKANVADLTTSNVAEGTNLYYTNARVYANVIGLLNGKVSSADLTTANVKELDGNLYYTNARVYANISPLLFNYQTLANATLKANVADLTTANVAELNNLYYTNARVYANVIGLLDAKANVADLDTSNVAEGTNLYYTNARVYANVIGLINGKVGAADLTTANVKELDGNLYYTNARVYANISPLLFNYQTLANATLKANVSDLTTSNVVEGNNLYYTNARVYANISPLLFNYQTLANAALKANVADLTTANVAELNNLYYTNNRVYANVIGLLNAKSNVVDLTTSNVVEGTNLYYTNARVYANVVAMLQNYTGNITAGNILANAIYGQSGGFITGANLISTNIISATTWTGLYAANVLGLNTANVAELTNLYYTNARVYANVIGLLNAKANVADLDTSNIIEGTNLYYTNARVYANVIGLLNNKVSAADLTTANVKELDGNLYYTNARVYSNISPLLFNYQTLANAALKANIADLTTANVAELNNLYYTNARVYANVIELFNAKANVTDLNTSNIIEGTNLYYTNARVYANVIGLVNSKANVTDLNTSNIIEGTNLYYTNARVYANVIGILDNYATAANLNLKANVADLTTSNVTEGTNLYYTNARVLAGLVTSNLVVNDATILGNLYVEGDIVTLNTATLSIEDKNIVLANGAVNSTTADGAGFNIDGAQANLKYRTTGDKFEFNKSLDVIGTLTATAVYSNTWNNLFTSNVIEGANLYYTVARANAAIDERVTKEFVDSLGISGSSAVFAERSNIANLVVSISNFTTSNLIEGANLYYTNARVYSNVISLLNAKANVSDLTTANVAELTNLYYTNARVYANVISLLDLKANVADLNTSNVIEGTNLYYTNVRVYANVISLLNAKANVSDLDTSNVIEGTNLYYTNARVYANIIPLLDLKANLTELTTSNVAELTNLYYTNARVYANVIPLLNAKANVVDLTTANVIESVNNLYYTNTRVYANVTERLIQLDSNIIPAVDELYDLGSPTHKFKDLYLSGFSITLGTTKLSSSDGGLLVNAITANIWNNLYTANVRETAGNLYYTNARVYANVIPLLNLKANVVDLTTANVSELTNLYYTNARVYANVIGLLNTKANVSDLTTSNVSEGNNLYYTNVRVYANVIPLLNTKANVVDLTTSNVAEGSSLYYTNARVYANVVALLPNVNVRIVSSFQQFVSDGATTVYTLSTSVVDETSIFVIIDGLTQIPSLDYTASAVTLTLLTVPANQSNVVVRYFSASLSL